jgi:hypothetical protein
MISMESVAESFRSLVELERLISDASTEDELLDLAVEKKKLRDANVLASLYYTTAEIHQRLPLLFPLVGVSLALKLFF